MRQIDSSADPVNHASKLNLGCGPVPDCRHADYFSGSVALAKKRFEEAESFFSKEVDLSYPFPQLSLALLYFERGMLREAEATWIRIPSISRYLLLLGEKLHLKDRRLSEARILYELAVKYEPENQTAHYLLGRHCQRKVARTEFSTDDRELGRPELTPLGECGGAVELEIVS